MMRAPWLVLAVLVTACEDTALVATVADLDRQVAERQTEAKMLLERAQKVAAGPEDPLSTGGPDAVKNHLTSLAVSDDVEVRPAALGLEIRLNGLRGRRQAAQSLIRFGVEAPTLLLEQFESKVDNWTMTLSLPRVRDEGPAPAPAAKVDVPEPSFLSFSGGRTLHQRAVKKSAQLQQLNTVVEQMKRRQHRRALAVDAVDDEGHLDRARRRRHFAVLLLPSVRDGSLSFAEKRATWKGEAGFADLDDAREILAARGKVVGFAPGKNGSVTVELE